jgi:putative ATP-dependent endonuclease of OLD family
VISYLRSQNYRSLEEVNFPLTPLTAIIGPNGAGKTSILRALELVLGTAWPSIRSLRIPHDFTGFDTDKELLIEVGFDPPLDHEDAMGKQHPIASLRFSCRPYKKRQVGRGGRPALRLRSPRRQR